MQVTPEPNVIEQLRERMKQRNLADVRITYRVTGGMPADYRIEEELNLSGNAATARVARGTAPPQAASRALELAEYEVVLQQIVQDAGSMVTRAEARFLPDSTVGSITVDVGGEEETYFFQVDEEAQQAQARSTVPEKPSAQNALALLLRRLVDTKGE